MGQFAIFLAALLALVASTASAQNYPVRPVRMLLPYAPGGPVDIVGRIVARKLSESFGQQFIVDNRAGAGGNIAVEIVARAAPDGYTVLMGANGVIAINPSLYKNLPADPEKDLAPVSMIASSAMVLVVHPSLPASSARQLIALAKAKPGAITYASAGNGSTAHLAGELYKDFGTTCFSRTGAGPAVADCRRPVQTR